MANSMLFSGKLSSQVAIILFVIEGIIMDISDTAKYGLLESV